MRKNARYHEGQEHCRDEHHAIEHGSRAELSSAGTTAEQVNWIESFLPGLRATVAATD
jgi:hypothetical protein